MRELIRKYTFVSHSTTAYSILEELQRSGGRLQKFLIITDSDYSALKLFENLKSFYFLTRGKTVYINNPYPGLYSQVNPSIPEMALHVNSVLEVVRSDEKEPLVVVTSVENLVRKYPLPEVLIKSTVFIKKGDELNLQEFLERISGIGYTRTEELPEYPGFYNKIGGVVNIRIPDYEEPLRIDFFGDEVESIYLVNRETGVRISEITDSVSIPPVTLKDAGVFDLKEVSKRFMEKFGVSSVTKPYINSIASGYTPPCFHNYFSVFHEKLVPFLDYFENSFEVVLFGDVFDVLLKIKESIKSGFESFKSLNEPASEPSELFANPDELAEKIKSSVFLWFSSVDGVDTKPLPQSLILWNELSQKVNKDRDKKYYALLKLIEDYVIRFRYRMIFFSKNKSFVSRLKFILRKLKIPYSTSFNFNYRVGILKGTIDASFIDEKKGIIFVSDLDIVDKKELSKTGAGSLSIKGKLLELDNFKKGDFVVHEDYGIGIFQGIVTRKGSAKSSDLLKIEYKNRAMLYLPVYHINKISKYIGSSKTVSLLDSLGKNTFAAKKRKVQKAIEKIAKDIVNLYAKRKMAKGFAFSVDFEALQEFSSRFPHELTPDQKRAISEIIDDMAKPYPMERLLCGDVGLGKTEVAMHAAFVSIFNGKQVIVVVPTTVLALQHERVFKERFKDYPVFVESLTRFKTPLQVKKVLEDLKEGKIDIIIGTHRLLQKDVFFKNPGLLIIDEEHRFGVKQKERIKALKKNIDVLSMSATPIPRTLEMSLTGIRDISIIETVPAGRKGVKSYIIKFDKEVIKAGILNEINRGGRVFFIHNRVETIDKIADFLKKLLPDVKIVVAHGKMRPREIEKRLFEFISGEAPVLVATTIVEAGLDIPDADTIFVNNAHRFGLSQLHQLRGRTGRGGRGAYAYFIVPSKILLSRRAQERIETIKRFSDLNSGLIIAKKDLEMRGAGNLLGTDQSGMMNLIGYNLYVSILEKVIAKLQKGGDIPDFEPLIDIPVSTRIPESFMGKEEDRTKLYKLILSSESSDELDRVESMILSGKKEVPQEVLNLFNVQRLKLFLKEIFIEELIIKGNELSIKVVENMENVWKAITELIAAGKLKMIPSGRNEFKKKLPRMSEKRIVPFIMKLLEPVFESVKTGFKV